MLQLIFDGSAFNNANFIQIFCSRFRIRSAYSLWVQDGNIAAGSGRSYPQLSILTFNDGFIVRSISSVTIAPGVKCRFMIEGNFNWDEIKIGVFSDTFNRVEVRNEYDVLITDNGAPWGDGTYPPDAKNRAELTGLHASPAVINPELETALMGDETNKERVQE